MKDAAGNTLRIGDTIMTMVMHYRSLVPARVIGFTPEMVRVKTDATYMMTPAERRNGFTLKQPSQVVLVITRAEFRKEIKDAVRDGYYVFGDGTNADPGSEEGED